MQTTPRFSFVALSAALAVLPLLSLDLPAQTAATSTTVSADVKGEKLTKLLQALNNSSPLNEITELTKAGVGDPVILTYIQNSGTSYNLSAQDIIKLRDQGVSPEVTSALIQRGTEVRQAAQEAANTSQATAVTAVPSYQTTPVVEVTTPAPINYVLTPVRPASTVSVTYIGYPGARYTPVYYPRYVTFGSGYCYSPRLAWGGGYGGYRFGGYHSSARFCR
jgi:hypothetical protein